MKKGSDYKLFLTAKKQSSEKIFIYDNVDQLFEAAYNYVEATGDKVRPCNPKKFSVTNKSNEFTGFITEQRYFFMIDRVSAAFGSTEIYDLLRRLEIKDIDYINQQMKNKVEMLKFYE